jgi:hypothetical protein
VTSHLDGPPNTGTAEAWGYGVIVAVPLFVYGLFCVVVQRAWLVNVQLRGVPRFPAGVLREWTGHPALALGVVFIGLGALVHFQWFWSNSPRLGRYYEIGKLASLVLFVAGLSWWIFETAW